MLSTPSWRPLAALLLIPLCSTAVEAAAEEPSAPKPPIQLDLDRVLRLVREANPDIAAARLRVQAAEADLLSARLPVPANPLFEAEAARRSGPEGATTDRGFSLSQPLFLGPVRSRRIRAVEAAIRLQEALADDRVRRAEAEAARLYYRALAARRSLDLARRVRDVTDRLLEVSELRFEAGEDTALQRNAARIEVAHARRGVLDAQRRYRSALFPLMAVLGRFPESEVTLSGTLDPPRVPPLEELAAEVADRPDLRAARSEAERRKESVARWKAERWPELEVFAFREREGGLDDITGGGVAVRIPLFDRKQGEIARALAEGAEARAARRGKRLEAEASLRAAAAAWRWACETVDLYDAQTLAAARENLELIELAYREGKMRFSEVLVTRQRFVDVQRSYLAARLERALAAVDLLTEAGAPITPAGGPR